MINCIGKEEYLKVLTTKKLIKIKTIFKLIAFELFNQTTSKYSNCLYAKN